MANAATDMGRYVPPEHEGVTSANKLAGKKALGNRARKSEQGILTVRFEMPFPIWCTSCPKETIIGQGVRFNAEKKKVGNYHSTPIFSFRMKHTACGGWIEIRTDPKNTAYVVTEGAKKRDTGEDKVLDGEIRLGATEEDRARMENDAFAALEGKFSDKTQAASDKSRIEELYHAKQRDWEDPGEANRRLRKGFRVERKQRQRKELATETLKDRMSLGIDLLEETAEDRQRASFIEFGDSSASTSPAGAIGGGGGGGADAGIRKVQARPLFAGSLISNSMNAPASASASARSANGTKKKSKSSILEVDRTRTQTRERLRQELGANTRTALDPFLGRGVGGPSSSPSTASLIKRKDPTTTPVDQATRKAPLITAGNLVDYDSD